MAGPERIEWRRKVPAARLAALGWYVIAVGAVLGMVWLLFGGEPVRLDNGRANPLALLPAIAVVLALFGALPFVLSLVRLPLVAATHHALTVRSGAWRTLTMPWANVAGVAAYRVGDEPYLLVRCRQSLEDRRDLPRWFDQRVLRTALRRMRRGDPPVGDFHLAVRMNEFAGDSAALLATLAAFAPDDVPVANDLADAT